MLGERISFVISFFVGNELNDEVIDTTIAW